MGLFMDMASNCAPLEPVKPGSYVAWFVPKEYTVLLAALEVEERLLKRIATAMITTAPTTLKDTDTAMTRDLFVFFAGGGGEDGLALGTFEIPRGPELGTGTKEGNPINSSG
jgi:hypothetical protein